MEQTPKDSIKVEPLIEKNLRDLGYTGMSAILTKNDGTYTLLTFGVFVTEPLTILGASSLMQRIANHRIIGMLKGNHK